MTPGRLGRPYGMSEIEPWSAACCAFRAVPTQVPSILIFIYPGQLTGRKLTLERLLKVKVGNNFYYSIILFSIQGYEVLPPLSFMQNAQVTT